MKKIISIILILLLSEVIIANKKIRVSFGARRHKFSLEKAVYLAELIEFSRRILMANPKQSNPVFPIDALQEDEEYTGSITVTVGKVLKQETFMGFLLKSGNRYILIIHGTSSPRQMIENMKTDIVKFLDIRFAGWTEKGFTEIFHSMKIYLADSKEAKNFISWELENFTEQTKLTIAGYSLGAALATLNAVVLGFKKRGIDIEMYTFGSPMVGNFRFVRVFEKYIKKSYRIFNVPDNVPSLPPFDPYVHVKYPVRLNSTKEPSIKDKIGCYHQFLTYLYLLGSKKYNLDKCKSK